MENKRNFTRVNFDTRGELKYKNKTISAEIKNLSLKGAFFVTAETIPINDQNGKHPSLVGSTSDLSVSAKGKVVRVEESGIGVNITEINVDSFIHLKNIIQYNSGDPEKTVEEFQNYLKNTLGKK